MKPLLYFLIAMAVLPAAAAQAQSPELIVEIDRTQIYEGESFVYRVTLNHVEDPPQPDLSGFDDFDTAFLGQQSLDSRQISIINGRRSEVIRRGRQFTWRLTPRRSGVLTIPAPTAEVDGETLTGRAVEVQVRPPDVQDTVILQQSVSRATVYPMQPFTVKLVIAVKDLPEPARSRDPLTVQPQLPVLNVPWLDDAQLSDGLIPERSWTQLLEPLISRRGYGVQVNSIGSASAFSLFDNRATGFHPSPQRTTREDADGEETGYWEYEFRRTLIPEQTGTYRLGAVSLKGTFADRMEGERLGGSDLYTVTDDLEVTVKDVPFEGRPDSYIGAVGTFELEAELAPRAVRVGDPMTLTLRLAGEGTLADARPPQLADVPGVSSGFRTYEATEESSDRSRTFVYSLRPLHAGVSEFPSIPVSCFDVTTEQYVTLRSTAFPVTVTEAETLEESDIVTTDTGADAETGYGLERSEGGVFANVSDLSALRNDAIRPVRWFAAWAGMVLVSGGLSLAIGRFRRLAGDPALKRRRQAPAAAATELQQAETQLHAGNVSSACDSIHRAVAGVIASWAHIREDGLTARDASEQLRRLGGDSTLAQQAEHLLQECDAARYGGTGPDASQLLEQARELVENLVRALRHSGGEGS